MYLCGAVDTSLPTARAWLWQSEVSPSLLWSGMLADGGRELSCCSSSSSKPSSTEFPGPALQGWKAQSSLSMGERVSGSMVLRSLLIHYLRLHLPEGDIRSKHSLFIAQVRDWVCSRVLHSIPHPAGQGLGIYLYFGEGLERHLFRDTYSHVLWARQASLLWCSSWALGLQCLLPGSGCCFPVAVGVHWGAASVLAPGKPDLQYGHTILVLGWKWGCGDLAGAPGKGRDPVDVIH